jgi:Cytochrome c554 and c-prime
MRGLGGIVALGVLAGLLLGAGRPAVAPGPAPSLRDEASSSTAATRNATCVACHQRAAAQWHASAHARSATNPAFVAAIEREPPARHDFCFDCHAPERRNPGRDAVAEQLGVACVTCHAPLGAVLATPGARPGPHGVLRTDWFGSHEACEGCHQFDYPGAAWPLQNTVAEAVELSDRVCQDCHMRPRDDVGHLFPGAYDADLVRGSVKVTSRLVDGQLRLQLAPTPPHAVPTGDLFRRLRLSVYPEAASPSHRYFGRRFTRRFDGSVDQLEPVSDTRLHIRPETVAVAVPAGSLEWELVLERVAFAPTEDPADDVVEGTVTIARGRATCATGCLSSH